MNAGLHIGGIACITVFVVSYILVLLEEKTKMSKSKPVMLGAGIIWVIIALMAPQFGVTHDSLRETTLHILNEYASLMLFLLASMTYISVLQNRNVFEALRGRLVQAGLNLRQLFWVTGFIAFFLSPIADNLTTALILGAVVIALGAGSPKFVALACINIVSAANAGGAFSPFGDITTLMVWQAGHVDFFEFFTLFLPSLVNFALPALFMSLAVSTDKPAPLHEEIFLKKGAILITILFLLTIAMAVGFEQLLGLPPFLGMMMGLSLLLLASWGVKNIGTDKDNDFDVFENVAEVEWDTLLFFFGIIFSVSGLGYLGYLEFISSHLYNGWGADITNSTIGILSSVLGNIPLTFAVLSMNPAMNHFQWLLVTLTAGVGGSLLSVGSAAGVGLMGASRGQYTFCAHLKWFPALLLGYFAAIATHYIVQGHPLW